MLVHSPELRFTTWTAGFTAILWVPIIINRLRERGAWTALKDPQPDLRPRADWAYRLANAHRNAMENLVVFAPLAIATHVAGTSSSATAAASGVFFASRVAHAVIYTLGIPLLRTGAFFVAFVCQAILLATLSGFLS